MNSVNPKPPLVSVIIPAYNAEAFISKTLDSVLSQTYKNIEVLVVDDGSKDRTPEIVKSFAQRDVRITLLQQPNKGVAAARNLAIEKSNGEYIAPVDADDIWYPQKLEKQVQCMLQSDPSVGLVYTWSVVIDENNLISMKLVNYLDPIAYTEGDVFTALVYVNFLRNASVPLIRRACFEKVGGYNCKLKEQNSQGCEDWDIYLRIAEFFKFKVVPEYLVGYRETISSMSCNPNTMARSYHLVMADVQQRCSEIPPCVFRWSKSSFYLYLAQQSIRTGKHWSTLYWLYKVLRADWMNLLNSRFYDLGIKSILKFLAQPITSLIWKDHFYWLQYKNRLKSSQPKITISDIENEMEEYKPLVGKLHEKAKLYDKMIWQRENRVMQGFQTIHPG